MKISGLFLTNSSDSQYSQSLNGSEGLPATITATRGTFSRSQNLRLNFDDTLSPTLLLHVGAGSCNIYSIDHSPTTDFNDRSDRADRCSQRRRAVPGHRWIVRVRRRQ